MVRLGNRTIGVNLVRNVSASNTPFAPLGLSVGLDQRVLYTFRPCWANTELTGFVARGPRASQC